MKLRNGMTPPQLVDEVLAKRIEQVGINGERVVVLDPLGMELRHARLQLRVARVVVIGQGLLLVIVGGLRLAGL